MTQIRITISHASRVLAIASALLLASAPALADEYGDVSRLIHSGKTSEALARVDQYLATKPKDPQMRFLKGVIQTETGQPTEAIGTFTRLTEDYPELPEPYNNLAVLYAGRSQFDKARAALEMAIRTNPSYATAHENLGDIYAKLASQAYSKALQLDASNTAVQPKLALIRELFAPANKGVKGSPAANAMPAAAPIAQPKGSAPAAAVAAAAVPAPPAVAAPASPAPSAPAASAPSSAGAAPNTAKEVEAAISAWANAWSSKQIAGYLAAYGKEFVPPGKQSRKAWEEERRVRIVGKSRISVQINDLAVTLNGGKAIARFKQRYSADTLNVSSRKTLELIKTGDRWLIVKESTGA